MGQFDVYLEAERRGILPEKDKAVLDEARKRGLINDETSDEPTPVFAAFSQPSVPENKSKFDQREIEFRKPGAAGRLMRYIPGLGGALDEIGAGMEGGLNYVTGGKFGDPYDVALEKQREAWKQSDAEHPVRNALEGLTGAVALTPFKGVRIFSRGNQANTINTAADAGINAGVLGGLEGFTSGEGGFKNRVENAKNYAQTSAALGMLFGGIGQQIANRYQPTPSNSLAKEAQDIGVSVPKFMEGTKSTSNIAAKMGSIPFVGDDINNAVALTRTQTAQAAQNISRKAAGGATSPQSAGEAAKASMQEYADDTIRQIQNRVYEPVHQVMGEAAIPLSATQRVSRQLTQMQNDAANTSINSTALNEISDAVERGSLNFRGISALRTRVGTLIDNKLDPNNRPARAALERIYGALSEDMENGIRAYGGPMAQRAWERANRLTSELKTRRQAITKVMGSTGQISGEGVVDKVWRLSGSNSSADAATITRLRRVMGNTAWREMSGSIIERLGRNASNEFSPDIFLKNYKALSTVGRNSLFDSNLKVELDKLARVSEKLQQYGKLGNASQTGGVIALLMSLATSTYSLSSAGIVAGTALAGRSIGRLMSRPAIIRQASRYYQAMSANNGRPSRTASVAASALANSISEETGEDPKNLLNQILATSR